ncbi:hypothetical protein MSWAN_0631 [Methanobacterium paludis]|uniref:Uncharacterized protein n=1 Tax=Methanobacterium paludis (strain DSM 25820 / JCM 18151 / SWAN1) TaxID=868131 RepID=F6D619_METPW|nr:hypothetical protein MSWAN_0631 [Methanobacterium paludis]
MEKNNSQSTKSSLTSSERVLSVLFGFGLYGPQVYAKKYESLKTKRILQPDYESIVRFLE